LRRAGVTNLMTILNPGDETLAISIPRAETAVIRHFQERMPHGLFVPELPANWEKPDGA
jgi:hypothetical protein